MHCIIDRSVLGLYPAESGSFHPWEAATAAKREWEKQECGVWRRHSFLYPSIKWTEKQTELIVDATKDFLPSTYHSAGVCLRGK